MARRGGPGKRPEPRCDIKPPKGHVFTVETEWTGGIRTVSKARKHEIVADGPLWRHGTDDGPAPGELVLAAAAACLVNHLVRFLQARRARVHGVTAKATGTFRAEGELEVFDTFRFEVTVRAPRRCRAAVEKGFKVARAQCTLLLIMDVRKEYHLEFVGQESGGGGGGGGGGC
jgi:uncharacterized OsmC-like protein